MPFTVIVDANVLFPFTLRDTMLRATAAGLYQLRWSAEILDETQHNLVSKGHMTADKGLRLRAAMENEFPDAMVTSYEQLTLALQNDPKDRHVVAAALKCGAQVIVTSNLRDFVPLPAGIEAQSPDEFLCNLFDLDQDSIIKILCEQAADLRKPSRTLDELLAALGRVVPEFVNDVQNRLSGR